MDIMKTVFINAAAIILAAFAITVVYMIVMKNKKPCSCQQATAPGAPAAPVYSGNSYYQVMADTFSNPFQDAWTN